MNKEQIIALARQHETNNPFMVDFKLSTEQLLAFAKAIQDKQQLPDVLFDGNAVYQEIKSTYPAKMRTSPENISDVLDAVVRIIRSNKE